MANVKFDRMDGIAQQDIDNLTKREATELMLYIVEKIDMRCQNCRMCVQMEDGEYVCGNQRDRHVEVNDFCSDFERE